MGISYRERMLAELKNRVISKPTIVLAKETIVDLDKTLESKIAKDAPKAKQTKAKKK